VKTKEKLISDAWAKLWELKTSDPPHQLRTSLESSLSTILYVLEDDVPDDLFLSCEAMGITP
jgi:hypothetical protein